MRASKMGPRALGLSIGLIFVPSIALAQPNGRPCTTHFYPAARLQSVGESFAAVKRVNQDLRSYDQAAGRPLEWLTLARQVELASQQRLAETIGINQVEWQVHDPLTRLQAADPARVQAGATACVLEISTPQLILERGGLAARSFRIFGVVRHFENGQLVRRYSGFASAPMAGFRLESPSDVVQSTSIVENSYIQALGILMRQSLGTAAPQHHP